MPAVRRALAALPVATLVAVSPAQAADVKTLPCVPYVSGQQTMPIAASGFTPGGLLTLYTSTASSAVPRVLTTARLDALGAFLSVPASTATAPGATQHQLPPPFAPRNRDHQTFTLYGEDKSNPGAPILASTDFQVVRFGMTRQPSPKRPHQRVTFTARGFFPGSRVYAHFRYRGRTRRTVSLGVAQGPCGITSRKMRALPTKIRYGRWRAYIDQSRRFSLRTRPQWIDPFTITRAAR